MVIDVPFTQFVEIVESTSNFTVEVHNSFFVIPAGHQSLKIPGKSNSSKKLFFRQALLLILMKNNMDYTNNLFHSEGIRRDNG